MSVALHAFLAPLLPYLNREGVSELCINEPKTLWLEQAGQWQPYTVETLSKSHVRTLAELLAEHNRKNIGDNPLLSATLPDGERCQFVLPPACDPNQIICSIRKPTVLDMGLTDWEARGAFAAVKQENRAQMERLEQLYKAKLWPRFLQEAVKAKCNIVISGGTSTAKTTFLNSCLKEIPANERLITIEGVREVKTTLSNCVHLLANEDNPDGVTMLDLLKVSLRLRPDRIFLSEIRSKEAYPYLRACISGHPGSMTTLHAESVELAKEQLCFMLAENPELQFAPVERLKNLIHHAVDVIIQMARNPDGSKFVEDIYWKGAGV